MEACLIWIKELQKHPTRDHYYYMQVAQEVRRVLCKDPNEIKIEMFKLPFGEDNKPDLKDDELPEGFPKRLTKQSIAEFQILERKQQIMMAARKPEPPPISTITPAPISKVTKPKRGKWLRREKRGLSD